MIGDGLMTARLRRGEMTLGEKLWQVSWSLLLLIGALAGIGVAMLYSAANGNMDPWASRHIARFSVGLALLLVVAMVDIRQWMRYAYWLYALALVLLVAVEVRGTIGMGAQRWIDLGVFQLQPSELMKVTLVLALARFFHGADLADTGRPLYLILPTVLVLVPVALVLKQPDLGTALMMLAGAGVLFFVAGVRLWMFGLVVALGLAAIPVAWQVLHDYQKQRVLTFINPERDPLGAGYHILQSKIALGSGGLTGKGFLEGTQSHLNFLPEKQTDFIFVMLAEEFGMLAGMGLLLLYVLVLTYGLAIALRARNHFGRLVAIGVTFTFFLYVFINVAMVMGLIPVVGVPLPLVSYGGTAMMTLMLAFGLLMSVWVHRDVQIGRRGAYDDG
ncbi:rod shape-determining protein RodA [Roseospira goensis]|uniref:Peptidoglycan glycosyltransferase MrdB n=1 Tax=Roseospira goensis TaxID=391922 RepID=A0A7W6WKA4_9PROT|nr:rod shape-determining protein RodA [Roseospira goensis]MBB4285554.1 rod shape determining protein RodA [Roseospira goensis]